MTNKERVIAAIKHQQPDRVPYNISFTQPALEKMIAYFGSDPCNGLDQCIMGMAPYRVFYKEVAPNIWQDRFGVLWDRSVEKDIGIVTNRLVTPETLDEYVFPAPCQLI